LPWYLGLAEYDSSIIQDVSEHRWAAAREGMKALQPVMMATKSPDIAASRGAS
jgi:hypothetical protein